MQGHAEIAIAISNISLNLSGGTKYMAAARQTISGSKKCSQ
jgi:hypothetical protein